MKKLLSLALVLLMLTALFAGCSKKPKLNGTMIVGITEASGNFNPLYYQSAYDGHVVDLVFESLIGRDFEGKYEGVVADSWETSEDGKSITFKMKKNKKFSDGKPVTANDVVFTYQVLADPSYTGRYGSLVKDMKGYDDYFNKKTEKFEGVVALDDYTVQFNFKEALRSNFENTTMQIVPKHYYGAEYKYGDTSKVETITTQPVGSGPYLMKEFKEKQLIVLERNANYVGEGYLIQNVILKFVDETTDIVELTNGGIDLLPGVIEPKNIQEARAKKFSLNQYSRSGYGYVKTNCEAGPTADVKVRQALYYSFNIEEFVNSYYKDEETGQVLANIQYHPFSQVSWAIDDTLLKQMTEYKFDLAKANQLLDEAGWVKNAQGLREKNGQVLELKIAAMPDHAILATLIPMWERDWAQGLGLKLNVAYLEFNTLLDYIYNDSDANVNNWSLFFLATSITTPDPHSLYSEFHSHDIGSGKDNSSRYNNPKIDQLLDQGKAIMDIEKAKPVYQEIAKILNEEAVMMPVYANTYFDLYNPKITNFKTSSLYDWTDAMKDAVITEPEAKK